MAEPNLDTEQKRALAAALVNCPSMADRAGRDAIIRQLPPDLQPRIPRGDTPLLDVTRTLKTVLLYPEGLSQLLAAVRYLEGASEPMAAVDARLAGFGRAAAGAYTLRPPVADFTGREHDLRALVDALRQLVAKTLVAFTALVQPAVRTPV